MRDAGRRQPKGLDWPVEMAAVCGNVAAIAGMVAIMSTSDAILVPMARSVVEVAHDAPRRSRRGGSVRHSEEVTYRPL